MNGPKAHEQAIGVIGDRGSAAGSRGGPPRDEASQSDGLGEGAWCRGPRVARRSDHAAGHVVRQFGSHSKTEERSYYVPAVPLLGASPRGPTACPQSTRARACAAAAFAAAGRRRRLECSSSARDEPARRVWPRPRVRTRRRHTVPRGRARKAACFTIPLMRTAQKPEAGARGGAGGE